MQKNFLNFVHLERLWNFMIKAYFSIFKIEKNGQKPRKSNIQGSFLIKSIILNLMKWSVLCDHLLTKILKTNSANHQCTSCKVKWKYFFPQRKSNFYNRSTYSLTSPGYFRLIPVCTGYIRYSLALANGVYHGCADHQWLGPSESSLEFLERSENWGHSRWSNPDWPQGFFVWHRVSS